MFHLNSRISWEPFVPCFIFIYIYLYRIKFTADLTSQQQQANALASTLSKTLVELGSSNDPLSKLKHKPPIIDVPPKPPVGEWLL